MDWWINPWAIAFMFCVAFLVILREWFIAHHIIDKQKKQIEKEMKEERDSHFWEIDALQSEIKNYKRRLGINE